MQKNVTYIILLALAMCLAIPLAGCGSHRKLHALEDIAQRDSYDRHAQVEQQSEESTTLTRRTSVNQDLYRFVLHFDTSKPADPQTLLPPVKSIEFEGEKIQAQEDEQEETDSSLTANASEDESAEGGVDVSTVEDRDSAVGTDNRLAGVFLGVIFVIAFILVANDISKTASVKGS